MKKESLIDTKLSSHLKGNKKYFIPEAGMSDSGEYFILEVQMSDHGPKTQILTAPKTMFQRGGDSFMKSFSSRTKESHRARRVELPRQGRWAVECGGWGWGGG